ncbi:MAG: Flp pilus assembly protein CpaB [Lentisphaerae bacterium]|nr:Flp pilus assembly protein CpaB [Lentisphaerota bacterium]
MQNRLPLIIAVVLGVVALLAVRSYVKRVEREAQSQLQGRPVVAVAQDVPRGTELTLDMLSPKDVPEAFIPPQAIEGSDNVKLIVGRKTRVDIAAGQVILWSDLEVESRGGFATLIPEGERAFSVPISRGVKGGSLLQPNDHVDIIGSFADKQEAKTPVAGSTAATWREKSDMVNVVLLQNVTVLAVGENFGGKPLTEPGEGGGDVTVSVTLPEAQLLMFASEHGELAAVLRREGDVAAESRDKLPRVTFKEIESLIGDLDAERKQRIVQIQKGQSVEAVSVDSGK